MEKGSHLQLQDPEGGILPSAFHCYVTSRSATKQVTGVLDCTSQSLDTDTSSLGYSFFFFQYNSRNWEDIENCFFLRGLKKIKIRSACRTKVFQQKRGR